VNPESFFKMSYGIYLVAARSADELSAYIANTVFQVTAFPPRIAISCHRDNHSAGIIAGSGSFSVSVLEKDTDPGLIGLFGYKSSNVSEKFDRVHYRAGITGSPVILTHAVAYYECRVTESFTVGTHILFIGEVVAAELISAEKEPLTYQYFREELQGFAPERAPTYVDKTKISAMKATNVKKREPLTAGTSYICSICAWVYDPAKGDPDRGIPPGTPFSDLPDDWVCPVCAAAKQAFISEN
jgi:flavin reductase (DIM6/NTAB) family NADH-FMN oxidoreductase RutF/rubredoxin